MNYKKARIISLVLALIAMGCIWFLTLPEDPNVLLVVITIALFVSALAVHFIFYRCPHCRKMLPGRGHPGDVCRKCGKKIDS
jgi:DMSO reductase anchor subunit